MENEMMYLHNKAGARKFRGASTDMYNTAGNAFQKPNMNLDPKLIKVNAKFDDIPNEPSKPNLSKIPPKPKTSTTGYRKDAKEERPLTDKLTNIVVDTKTMTSHNVERRIERLHTTPKELTQKPNFGRYQPQQGFPAN